MYYECLFIKNSKNCKKIVETTMTFISLGLVKNVFNVFEINVLYSPRLHLFVKQYIKNSCFLFLSSLQRPLKEHGCGKIWVVGKKK